VARNKCYKKPNKTKPINVGRIVNILNQIDQPVFKLCFLKVAFK